MPRLVHPNKRRPFKAVVMDTEMPESENEALNSLLVVSSLLCIKFSMDCKAAEVNLVGTSGFGQRLNSTVCLKKAPYSPYCLSTGTYSLPLQ